MPITRRNDKQSRQYWKIVDDAGKEVKKWPGWKKEIRLMDIFGGDDFCHPDNNQPKKKK
jgi:hypothetical protein